MHGLTDELQRFEISSSNGSPKQTSSISTRTALTPRRSLESETLSVAHAWLSECWQVDFKDENRMYCTICVGRDRARSRMPLISIEYGCWVLAVASLSSIYLLWYASMSVSLKLLSWGMHIYVVNGLFWEIDEHFCHHLYLYLSGGIRYDELVDTLHLDKPICGCTFKFLVTWYHLIQSIWVAR